jgi:hypothetical protein
VTRQAWGEHGSLGGAATIRYLVGDDADDEDWPARVVEKSSKLLWRQVTNRPFTSSGLYGVALRPTSDGGGAEGVDGTGLARVDLARIPAVHSTSENPKYI